MRCRQCGTEISDASTFCNHCGAGQEESAPAFPAASTGASNFPEKTLWTGRCSAKAEALHWILWFAWLAIAAVLYLTILAGESRVLRLAILVAALLPGVLLLVRIAFEKLTVRYRLTNQRLFRQRGFLSRRLDELELIRVDDVAVTQDFLQRLLNVGTVTVLSTDATDPKLAIEGISDPLALKEMIRAEVRARRSRTTFLETL